MHLYLNTYRGRFRNSNLKNSNFKINLSRDLLINTNLSMKCCLLKLHRRKKLGKVELVQKKIIKPRPFNKPMKNGRNF